MPNKTHRAPPRYKIPAFFSSLLEPTCPCLKIGHRGTVVPWLQTGVVVVAGMSIGTLFTLFVLPAVYTVLAKDHLAAARSTRTRELAQVS